MATIKIPKTPRSAYNPQRAPNGLILAHVRELERALRERGGKIKWVKPTTEEEAAAYIRQLTRGLHQQILLPELKAGATTVVKYGGVAGKTAKRKSGVKRRASRHAKRRRS